MSIFQKLKAIFGGGDDYASGDASSQEAVGIIQAYGKVIEERGLSPSIVVDSKHLPYSKERIKEAILFALRANKDPAQRKHLATGYLLLADFQEGVGDQVVGIDLAGIDPAMGDINKLAESVSKQHPGFERWNPMVEKEQSLLLEKLRSAGYEESA